MGTYRRSYIVRHKHGWRYKRAVPDDLQTLVGAKAWSKYLGDIGKREAENQGRALGVEHQRLIDGLRAMTATERANIAAKGGLPSFTRELELSDTLANFVGIVGELGVPDPGRTDKDQADEALAILRSRQEAQQIRAKAAAERNTLAKVNQTGSGLDVLPSAWQRGNKTTNVKSIADHHRSLQRFVELVGNLQPNDVTPDHAAKYRDHLDRSRFTPRTKRKYLEHMNTLFRAGKSQQLVRSNPFDQIKIAKTGGKFVARSDRKPFEPDQVRAIFDALPGETPDFQWVTRLCAYHGARSGEIAQLRREDVTVSFGITVLRIHDEHGSVKNRQSVRTIPLHPACKDFVKYAIAAKDDWIFSSFPVWSEGRRGAAYQRRATDFLRKKVKITDRALTMHSLRHTWMTLAREINMPLPVSHAIAGHSMGSGEHAKYGTVPSLKSQFEWLSKIDPLA